MKKLLYILAVALVALPACKEKITPDPEPDPDVVTLTSEAVVNVGEGSEIVTIKFTTNVAWTAEVTDEFIVLNKKSGEAGDNELKATVQSLPEDEDGRATVVNIIAGEASAQVQIFQGKVFWVIPSTLDVSISGGHVEFSVITNLDYSVKLYNDVFTWAPASYDEATKTGSFDVAANTGFDFRSAYVKFTVPAIQVEDEENGGTMDAVYRVYVYQPGTAEVSWQTLLGDDFYVGDGATASVALFGGKLLVSDAQKVHIMNPATGEFEGVLATGDLPVQSITNDDAGNLLLANLGPYESLYDVYAVKADDSNLANPVRLIHCVNEAWNGSTGIDKVAAKGNVFGDGVVTAISGGVYEYGGVSYGLYWDITGGKAPEQPYNEWNPIVNQPSGGWFQTPNGGDNIWVSNRAAFVPAGASSADGFFYGGYDGGYNVHFYNGSEWIVSVPEAGDWGGGPQGMAVTTWDGKKILAFVQMGYTWWAEGWGMPSYLWLVDVTNPASPEVLSKVEYCNWLEQNISGGTENSSLDVCSIVEGGDLFVYFVDSSQGHVVKVKFPKL